MSDGSSMLSVIFSLLAGSGNVYPSKCLVETAETSISEEHMNFDKTD